jgi:hypothetical protein
MALACLLINLINVNVSNGLDRHDPMHRTTRPSYGLDALGLKASLQRLLGSRVACSRLFNSE